MKGRRRSASILDARGRTLASVAVGLLAIGCGKGGGARSGSGAPTAPAPSGSTAAPATAEAPPPAAPPTWRLPATVDGRYALAPASSVVTVPGGAVGFVFVATGGSIRVGRTASVADATSVSGVVDVEQALIRAAGPEAPDDPDLEAGLIEDPLGRPETLGVAVGVGLGPGLPDMLATPLDAAATRTVLVIDRAAPAGVVSRVVEKVPGAAAVAVDSGGAAGGAALTFAIATGGLPERAARIALIADVAGVHVVGRDGHEIATAASTRGGAIDRAAVAELYRLARSRPDHDAVTAVQVVLRGDQPFADVVTLIDVVVAGGATAVEVQLDDPRRPAGALPTVRIGAPDHGDGLDKAVIRRYIKRSLDKISYCYEKALIDAPDLEGTVAARFTIGADGKVASSDATGVNPVVSTCVAGVIATIEFPRPTGGGAVTVNYPFVFHPTRE